MKQARIYMKRWLGINERSKQLSTDTWYLNFANQLLSLIDESPLYSKKFEAEGSIYFLCFKLFTV